MCVCALQPLNSSFFLLHSCQSPCLPAASRPARHLTHAKQQRKEGIYNNFIIKMSHFERIRVLEGINGEDVRWGEEGHRDVVNSVAFSASGYYLASGSADKTAKVWHVETGECHRTMEGHSKSVISVAFSPDEKYLASASADHTVKLWRIDTGEHVRTMEGHSDWVYSVAFSPDGQTLATGGGDRTIKLWHVETGVCLKTMEKQVGRVYSVAFSPDGQYLASGCENMFLKQAVKLWSVETGKCIRTMSGMRDTATSVAFSSDGQYLASGSKDGFVKVWRVRSNWRKITYIRCMHHPRGWVNGVAFSPDGQYLASCNSGVKLWITPQYEQQLQTNERVYALLAALKHNNSDLYRRTYSLQQDAGGLFNEIRKQVDWFDIENNRELLVQTVDEPQPFTVNDGYVHDVAFSSNGYFASAYGSIIRLYKYSKEPQNSNSVVLRL